MHRLAIFVEGYTEALFVAELTKQIAGARNVQIEHRQVRGGTNAPRKMTLIHGTKQGSGHRYFVLIVDCGGDEQVKTRIQEEHENLTKQNYAQIIGIRDVRPKFTHADIPKLEAGLPKYIKTSLIPVQFVLSVMELEAWFLAEFTHFPRIDEKITVEAIRATLGFDPEHGDMSLRLIPANDLNACYLIGGKTYAKNQAQATVSALDFDFIYIALNTKIPYMQKLIASIDAFLA